MTVDKTAAWTKQIAYYSLTFVDENFASWKNVKISITYMKGAIKNPKDCYRVKICHCVFKFYSSFSHNKWLTGMRNYMKALNLETFKSTPTVNFFDASLLRHSLRKSDSLFNTFVVSVIHIVSVRADVKTRYHLGMSLPLTLFWRFYKRAKLMEILKITLSDFPCPLIERQNSFIILMIKISYTACTVDNYFLLLK